MPDRPTSLQLDLFGEATVVVHEPPRRAYLRQSQRLSTVEEAPLLFRSEDTEGRPRTFGECPTSGPCPWVSCRYHRYLDVDPATGAITVNFPDLAPEYLDDPCVLRLADDGARDCHQVADLLGMQRETPRLITLAVVKRVPRVMQVLAELRAHTESMGPDLAEQARLILDRGPKSQPRPNADIQAHIARLQQGQAELRGAAARVRALLSDLARLAPLRTQALAPSAAAEIPPLPPEPETWTPFLGDALAVARSRISAPAEVSTPRQAELAGILGDVSRGDYAPP